MKLSIITINKNNSYGLAKTIQSVVNQMYKDFEYIVIDGNSIDNSVEILTKYNSGINYWISEPDTGIYNAMNKGIRRAQGEYCLFLNSGDRLNNETTLQDVFNEINESTQADIFYSDCINSDGTSCKYPNNIDINFLLDNPINHQNTLIKKNLFVNHGYYNENLVITSDWEFFLNEMWQYKSTFSYIKTNISVYDIHGISSRDTSERYSEMLTVYQNVFYELTNTIIEVNKYHKITHRNVIEKYGNTNFLVFLLRIYKYGFIFYSKTLKLIKKILSLFSFILKAFVYFQEMFSSIFDKKIRICFTNFQDVPPVFFLKPLCDFLALHSYSYIIVKYYNPHIHFFSVFGKKNKIINSKALIKIFYSGENTNNLINDENYSGNCVDNVSLSFGFDYIESENYLRFPLWLLYYFSTDDTKDVIKYKLIKFKNRYKKFKFCALVASHDKSGIRTKIYNEASKLAPVDCPGSFLHNDDTLHKRYANDKAAYLQQYKFNICPENSISKGYVTEKLFQSLYSGCIPIYNGWSRNPEPDIVNPDIILWYDENNNFLFIDEIKKLYLNEKLYNSFIDRPFFCDTAVDKIYLMLQQFTDKIHNTTSKRIHTVYGS